MDFQKFIKASNFFPTFAPEVKNYVNKSRGKSQGHDRGMYFSLEDLEAIHKGMQEMTDKFALTVEEDRKLHLKIAKKLTTEKKEQCERCKKQLEGKETVWLELSQTDGNYYMDLPKEHVSQGAFHFGDDCARLQLRETKNRQA